jgi:choline dehydrogenase-like flavoprotein
MTISERIKKLGKYFGEMQVVEQDGQQIIYVVVNFPPRWVIDDEFANKKNVTIMEGQIQGEYYFSTDLETGEEVIFDVIDDNIEKMQEAIERAKLLGEKTKELKEIFEDENTPIEKLRTIRFCFDEVEEVQQEDIIITKGRKKGEKNDE